RLYRDRAYCYLQLGKIRDAEKDYLTAIKINSQCSRCYLNFAIIENLKDNKDSAIFYANKAISLNDTDAYNYIVRAQIFALRKENFSAESDYDKAISMHPTNGDYYFYRS